MKPWFSITYFTLTLLAFICHIIGLVVLWRVKSPAVNQRIIIINLALTELLFCANQLAYYAEKKIFSPPSVSSVKVNQTLRSIVHTANKLVMIHLTLDRFADIYLNLKYALHFSRERVIKILSAIWIVSIVYGVTLGIIMEVFTPTSTYPRVHYQVTIPVSIVLDIIITLSAIGTYSYLFYKVRSIMNRDTSSNGNNTENKRSHPSLKFLVPFLMIATYLAFNVSGTVISIISDTLYANSKTGHWLFHVSWLMIGFGYLTDAILYIFLQKDVRSFITSFITCKRGSINRSSAVYPS